MSRRAIYQQSDHLVVNVIEAEEDFDPGAGLVLGPEGGEIGDTWNGSSYDKTSLPAFEALKADLISSAWGKADEFQSTLTVTVKGHEYGCDEFSQSAINALSTAIANNVAPDPIVFTPKGERDGVSHTNAEFLSVASAVMNKVDAIIKAYLAHKKAILGLSDDEATLQAYDLSKGWPV